MTARLKPGQTRILASGTHNGVAWEDYERAVPGTIGVTRGYRLVYEGRELTTTPRGRDVLEAAEEFRAHIDGIPQRIAEAEARQAASIRAYHREELARERARQEASPLSYSSVTLAYQSAHGRQAPKSVLSRWAHGGVSPAERASDWYQSYLKAHPRG